MEISRGGVEPPTFRPPQAIAVMITIPVGCRLLAEAFIVAGYHVSYPKPDHGDCGVMIVSRIQAHPDYFGDRVGYLDSRAAAITLPTASGPIHVIGTYVPSCDAGVEKTERKRKWLAACTAALASRDHSQPTIFLGDLNVLEPDHQPRYRFFAPFEYAFYRQLTDDCSAATATVTVTVEPQATGTTTATSNVSATESDPNSANNTAAQSTTITNAHGCTITGTSGNDDPQRQRRHLRGVAL